MLSLIQAMVLIFVAAGAPVVALTRNPVAQALVVSFYGLLLAILFFVFQAPDVSLSQIVIGAVALPLMILLALTKIKKQEHEAREHGKKN
jgi:energy-converting hydrogenase B subunit D